jgi:hypothetical protein
VRSPDPAGLLASPAGAQLPVPAGDPDANRVAAGVLAGAAQALETRSRALRALAAELTGPGRWQSPATPAFTGACDAVAAELDLSASCHREAGAALAGYAEALASAQVLARDGHRRVERVWIDLRAAAAQRSPSAIDSPLPDVRQAVADTLRASADTREASRAAAAALEAQAELLAAATRRRPEIKPGSGGLPPHLPALPAAPDEGGERVPGSEPAPGIVLGPGGVQLELDGEGTQEKTGIGGSLAALGLLAAAAAAAAPGSGGGGDARKLAEALTESVISLLSRKPDLGDIDGVARKYRISNRHNFGNWIEREKKYDPGSANDRGDYTREELEKKARQYKRQGGQ